MTTTKPPDNMFSSSTIRNFSMCPQYFYLRNEKGLVPSEAKPSTKAEFGTAMHLAAQLLDEGNNIQTAIIKAAEYFRPFEPAPTISVAGNEIESLYTCVRLATIIVEYVEFYKNDPIKTWEGQTELGMAEEIDGGVFYCGRIDRIVKEARGIRAADMKTTKALASYIYNPHDQLTGYQWLVGKMFMEILKGVLFDMIGLTKSKRTFHREYVTFTKFQIQNWIDSTLYYIEQIYNCRAKGYWPKRTQKCNDFFNPCEFIPVCTAYDEVGRERIMNCYHVSYWFSYQLSTEKEEENKIEPKLQALKEGLK